MKNKLTDLNNHLFAQIERLGDENMKEEQIGVEIRRAKAISDVAKNIIENANLALSAEKLRVEYAHGRVQLPKMIGSDSNA